MLFHLLLSRKRHEGIEGHLPGVWGREGYGAGQGGEHLVMGRHGGEGRNRGHSLRRTSRPTHRSEI